MAASKKKGALSALSLTERTSRQWEKEDSGSLLSKWDEESTLRPPAPIGTIHTVVGAALSDRFTGKILLSDTSFNMAFCFRLVFSPEA